MQSIDFVIPLKERGLITQAVLEGIDRLYSPRRILIITDLARWKPHDFPISTPLHFIDENFFFGAKASKEALQERYEKNVALNPGPHRTFGWWYQQILKLGCPQVVKDLSEPYYVVWDSDLIPLRKWDLVVGGKACTAILQLQPHHRAEAARAASSGGAVTPADRVTYAVAAADYGDATRALTNMMPLRPGLNGEETLPKSSPGEYYGTFVSHHMVFKVQYVEELLALIKRTHQSAHGPALLDWQYIVLDLLRSYFGFSEYETYQTYCFAEAKPDNCYHPYRMFGGEDRARFMDGVNRYGVNVLNEIAKSVSPGKITYDDVVAFVRCQLGGLFDHMPSYLQIDHV